MTWKLFRHCEAEMNQALKGYAEGEEYQDFWREAHRAGRPVSGTIFELKDPPTEDELKLWNQWGGTQEVRQPTGADPEYNYSYFMGSDSDTDHDDTDEEDGDDAEGRV